VNQVESNEQQRRCQSSVEVEGDVTVNLSVCGHSQRERERERETIETTHRAACMQLGSEWWRVMMTMIKAGRRRCVHVRSARPS